MTEITRDASEDFIAKWSGSTASELSTAQSFAIDLCKLLGVAAPHPDAELHRYLCTDSIHFVLHSWKA